MLITNDVKVIKSEDKKSYTSFTFEKYNFELGSNDAVQEYKPTTDGKPTQVDGKDFTGTQAKNEVTADLSADAIQMLLMEAVSYCEGISQEPRANKKGEPVDNPYTDKETGQPIQDAGTLYLLALATQANTARIRLMLDASNREKSADPKALFASMVKTKIKEALALRKVVLTEDKAAQIVLKSEARGMVDAAEENGEELTYEDALVKVTALYTGK